MRYRLRTLLIVLALLFAATASGQEHPNPADALYGEWQIIEMVFRGKVQGHLKEKPAWFIIDQEGWLRLDNAAVREQVMSSRPLKKLLTLPCVIRQNEVDIDCSKLPIGKGTIRVLYEIKDGTLKFAYRGIDTERPTHFDAVNDPRITLYVAKKVERLAYVPFHDPRRAVADGSCGDGVRLVRR
jgi:uncharacterized protein (TIGR03067 family)